MDGRMNGRADGWIGGHVLCWLLHLTLPLFLFLQIPHELGLVMASPFHPSSLLPVAHVFPFLAVWLLSRVPPTPTVERQRQNPSAWAF